MSIGGMFSIFIASFSVTYSWLIQYLVNPLVSFAKGFEFSIMIVASVLFLLITAFVVLRQARKLPKSYRIEITDVFGHENVTSELRRSFLTYEAAESYAREYRRLYGQSQKFRVVGISSSRHNETNKV